MKPSKRKSDPGRLVLYKRPDLTPYLIHLTKNTSSTDKFSAYENLVHILETGKIWGSGSSGGFIKGPNKATCFMDVPFPALKFILDKDNADPGDPRYEAYGVVISKKFAYKHGCRPVLYLSDEETSRLKITSDEIWRVVRFEQTKTRKISWIHEREWRCKGSFHLPKEPLAVLVQTTEDAAKLAKRIAKGKPLKSPPQSIIPIEIMCQGLPFLMEK
ncbi:MAG: hypothetical protein Q7S40_28990 [Opitutaceae bacterium]|nr:hypothetical protein [Opitutaceae bacterium]